jgi:glycerol-3-phosphate acyltransferase PlsY
LYAFLCAFIVIVKHRENIARLSAGTENRLQLLKR